MKLYVAREENGILQLFRSKPTKFVYSYPWNSKHGWFVNDEDASMEIDSNLFPNVKWGDAEPTEVELVIKK